MKKIIYSLSLFILGINIADANIVALNKAQTVGSNFYSQSTQKQVVNITLAYTETNSAGEPVYYVFNMNGQEGFIIVSAEDATHPIIGYSTEGNYIVPSATSNAEFNFWMEKRKSEIIVIRAQNAQANSEISAEWNNLASNKISAPQITSVVHAALVQSRWNQSGGGSPSYNSLCPGGSVTGCVATAMAQIMRFWNYPSHGNGSSSYSAGSYGTLSANYGSTTYHWANMPLTSSNSDVALISYHCGISVEMGYSPSGSGAEVCIAEGSPSAEYAYPTYFLYAPTLHCEYQPNYSKATWIQMLEAELAAGRPVQYEGYSTAGGHTWICDGNDASDKMHMNWGWGGYDNGYFAVDSLAPSGQAAFTYGLGALMGIQPEVATTALDAGLFIASSNNTSCNPFFTPQLTLKNFGSTEITSCKINYHLDNGSNIIYTWNGSLYSFQTTVVTLPTLTVSPGAHTFTSFTSNPNLSTDGNPANDQVQTIINVISSAPSATPPYAEGFETTGFPYNDDYLFSSAATQWNRTSSASYTSSSSLELDNFSPTTGDIDEFITPAIDLSNVTSPTLTFELSHAQRDSADMDILKVFTSSNCGASWTSRYAKSAGTLATAGILSTAFTPSSSVQWRKETVNILNVAGQSDVRFKFQFTSAGAGNNIFIDDINMADPNAAVPEELADGFNLSVFPNPFNDNTTISFNLLSKYNVSIALYDIVGREVLPVAPKTELSTGTHSLPLNANTLKSGIYFVKLNVDGYSVMKKIVVQ